MIPLVLFSLFVLCLVLMPYIIHAFVTSKKYSRYIAIFMISMATKYLCRKLYCLTSVFVLIALHIVFNYAFPYDRSIIYSTALIIVFASPKRTDKIFNLINTDDGIWPNFFGVLILTFLMLAAYFLLTHSLCLLISMYVILLASYYYPSTKVLKEVDKKLVSFIDNEIKMTHICKKSVIDFVQKRQQDNTLFAENYISFLLNKPYLNFNAKMPYISTFFLPFWDVDYALYNCPINILYNTQSCVLFITLNLHKYLSCENVSTT